MPVYNERATVERAIAGVLDASVSDSFELVVVDDGSTDGTAEFLQGRQWPPEVRVLRHERNRGKGAALRTALAEARGEYSTIMDADLELSPTDIALLLKPLRSGEATAVFGTRSFKSHPTYSFQYVVGNRAVTFFANLLFNCRISDIMTGQKAMSTELFRSLGLRACGFGIEAEITGRLARKGVRIYEVPVAYSPRSHAQGKKLRALDGLRVVGMLLRCRFA